MSIDKAATNIRAQPIALNPLDVVPSAIPFDVPYGPLIADARCGRYHRPIALFSNGWRNCNCLGAR